MDSWKIVSSGIGKPKRVANNCNLYGCIWKLDAPNNSINLKLKYFKFDLGNPSPIKIIDFCCVHTKLINTTVACKSEKKSLEKSKAKVR